MADMVNEDYRPNDGQDPQPEDYITNNKTMKHDFQVLSTKTARKDGVKYLGKNGEQAWRVSTKIGKEWYANMIYSEDEFPVKGKSYEIELTEEGDWKNWSYKLLSKKEQILEQTAPPITPEMEAESLVNNTVPSFPPKDDYAEKVSRGASFNLAFQYCLKEYSPTENYSKGIGAFCIEVAEVAEKITKHQSKFVNNE